MSKYANYLAELNKEKPVLTTGDYNVAHNEIDLAKSCWQPPFTWISPTRNVLDFTTSWQLDLRIPSATFTAMFQNLTLGGHSAPRPPQINNTGWRIDYWLTSNRVADKVTKSDMIDSGACKTHTPIVMEIEL